MKAAGRNQQGRIWNVAIEVPTPGGRAVQQTLPLAARALATSGDYRNYFEADGVRYSHLIDPRSGRPIAHRLASVSVLDPSCMTADAWATALIVLGPEKGHELATRHGVSALLITRSETGFETRSTDEWEASGGREPPD